MSLKVKRYRLGLMVSTDELFDIIVDYPDSLAALEDLKVSFYRVLLCSLTTGLPD